MQKRISNVSFFSTKWVTERLQSLLTAHSVSHPWMPLATTFANSQSAFHPRHRLSPHIPSTPTAIRQNHGHGFQLAIDEIKVEKRLRWDADRNIILGPCREDVKPYSVEFRTMEQPKAIVEGICGNKLHFASEVCVRFLSSILNMEA